MDTESHHKSLNLPKPIDYTKLTNYQRQQQRAALLAVPKRDFDDSALWDTIRRVNIRFIIKVPRFYSFFFDRRVKGCQSRH